MGDITIRILAGICGAALFTVINQYVLTLSGTPWLVATVVVFVVSFIAALVVQRRLAKPSSNVVREKIGSKNVSGGAMKLDVTTSPTVGSSTSSIGSENKSADDMTISIKTNSRP